MKYLILGAGYIGQYLFESLKGNAVLFPSQVDSFDILEHLLLKEYPSHTLINCAGVTGKPNIDWCEEHKDITFGSNVGLPVMIAETCKKLGKYWVHIGSGCIYDGYDKNFTEEDEPNFDGSFYSKTKMWSQEILSGYDEPLILRIRMPIDEKMSERCYISKIIKYAREGKPLFSTANSMTVLKDLSAVITILTAMGETGTFNVVNDGSLTAEQILEMYKKYCEPKFLYKILPIEDVQKNLKARRCNCILSIEKLESCGIRMPILSNAVENILKDIANKDLK